MAQLAPMSQEEIKGELRRLWNSLHQLLISEHTEIDMFVWPGETLTLTEQGTVHEMSVTYRWRDRRETAGSIVAANVAAVGN
jgi:hypothetical protein